MKVMVRKSSQTRTIRKSHGLFDRATGEFMGMGNPDVLREDHEHPWYNQWEDEGHIGLRAHHPIHAQNAAGELLFNDDGTPMGDHPIDAMMKHLGGFLSKNWGVSPEDGFAWAKRATEFAIRAYNSEHADDSHHRLSPVDSVQWRRNYMVPYDKHAADPTERRLRGAERISEYGPRPQGTYNLNSQNPRGSRATGVWADSGLIPMNRELGQVLHVLNRQLPEIDSKITPIEDNHINNLEYVAKPHISVDKLTNNRLVATNAADAFHMGESGRLPEHLAPEGHMDDHPGQLVGRRGVAAAGLHPAMTAVKFKADGSVGTPRGRKGGEDALRENKAAKMRRELAEHGLELTDEELAAYNTMGLSSWFHGRPNEEGSKGRTIINNLASIFGHDIASIKETDAYKSLVGAGRKHGGGRGQNQAARLYAALAHEVGPDALREAEYEHPGHRNTEEYDALAQRIVEAMAGDEHFHDYSQELKPLPPNAPEVRGHNFDERFVPHIITSAKLAPHHNMRFEAPPPQAPPPQAPPPQAPPITPSLVQPSPSHVGTVPAERWGTRRITPQEEAARRMVGGYTPEQLHALAAASGSPISERRAAQLHMGADPQQTFFDIQSPTWPEDPTLVRRSEKDIRESIMKVQQALEKMQIEEAMNEAEIKKYLPHSPLSSSLDVGLFAKSMDLTSNDVWAIHSMKGDWDDLAKDWRVPIDIVKAIKVAMEDYRG